MRNSHWKLKRESAKSALETKSAQSALETKSANAHWKPKARKSQLKRKVVESSLSLSLSLHVCVWLLWNTTLAQQQLQTTISRANRRRPTLSSMGFLHVGQTMPK